MEHQQKRSRPCAMLVVAAWAAAKAPGPPHAFCVASGRSAVTGSTAVAVRPKACERNSGRHAMEQMDWTVQTLLDIRILVLNKTADHSFMRLYADFLPDMTIMTCRSPRDTLPTTLHALNRYPPLLQPGRRRS